ncbi:hypothetical protein B0H19DRAFT_926932, partial [Mycena capillaripes]
FFLADFGWLVRPKTGRRARKHMKPGKNCDGYFTNEDILAQAKEALEILPEFGDEIEHAFIYDNTTTHKKCADDALSARKMPKTKPGIYKTGKHAGEMRPNFLVERTLKGPDGKPLHNPDGSFQKEKIQMASASFHDGRSQALYVKTGPDAGLLKGMQTILMEWGFEVKGMKAECEKFQCPVDAHGNYHTCCMHRILFNEPDFFGVQSLLEEECALQGVSVLFLPKFHCDETMTQTFCNCSLCYADAYAKGMNGQEAAYATKVYCSHRAIPSDYLQDFARSGVLEAFRKLCRL